MDKDLYMLAAKNCQDPSLYDYGCDKTIWNEEGNRNSQCKRWKYVMLCAIRVSGFLKSTNVIKSHKASHMNFETDAQPAHIEKIQTKQLLLSSKVSSTH